MKSYRMFNSNRTLKPAFAVIPLALSIVLSLLVLKTGLHVSGIFSAWCPVSASVNAGTNTGFFCSPNGEVQDKFWIGWMVTGIFIGALFSAFWRTSTLNLGIEKISRMKSTTRFLLAGTGGLLAGFGAALAEGCTSSIGLTGASLLSVGSFVFLIMFFLGGITASFFFGRFWHE